MPRSSSTFTLLRPPRPAAFSARGSVLIVALLVAALIALVLGSYLSLNLGSARLAQRTFDRGAAFHLAEAGLEEGLWSFNRQLANQADAWEGWTVSGDAAWRRFDGFQLTAASSGAVKVYASPVAADGNARPTLVALASVQSPGGAPVSQLLEVNLRRRSFFSAGLVARESLAFHGRNTFFDSWDSDPDRNPATPAVPYSEAVKADTGEIATGADRPEDLNLNRARILGYLRTRGLTPLVSSPGFIGPMGTADGVIDFSRTPGDYREQAFPVIEAPTDGRFLASLGATLGTAGEATSWQTPSLRLSRRQTLTIRGHVTLVLTDPMNALSISGEAAIIIPEGSSLTLYVLGDILVAGRGFVNENPAPGVLQIWSTARPGSSQRISLAGRGVLAALLYAPEAEFATVGTAEFYGALVARTVTFAGNAAFHHDLALGRETRHAPYRGDDWRSIDDPVRRAELLPLVDR